MTKKVDYSVLTDEEIVSLAQQGDKKAMDYIAEKYEPFVHLRSGPYFLAGAEKDDLVQEGFIGLYKAIKSFDATKRAGFKTFAGVCIVRQMITAVKTSTRKKNHPLNYYVSIHGSDEGTDTGGLEIFEDPRNLNPERIVIERENAEDFVTAISALLSDFERRVLTLYLSGISYKEIAEYLQKTPKTVDNALSRVKRKIEKYLENPN